MWDELKKVIKSEWGQGFCTAAGICLFVDVAEIFLRV